MNQSFYILHSLAPPKTSPTRNALASLTKNFKSVDLLISQAYKIDENGIVSGFLEPQTVTFIKEHGMKLMVLVTNVGFDTKVAHQFLSNPDAQKKATDSIIKLCVDNHYYGVQWDFEGIALADRSALTHFYLRVSKELHKKGFKVSYAVIPMVSSPPFSSGYLKKKYENWAGAYDVSALSKDGDFITIMAYDQHTQGTTPGPTAGLRWVEAAIKYTLKFAPPNKVSLGIPVYSGYWSTHERLQSSTIKTYLADISYTQVKTLLSKFHPTLHWDNLDKIHYATYQHNWLNEYIFVEDAPSMKAKLKLAKDYHLWGISVFNLGNEDPNIWELLRH